MTVTNPVNIFNNKCDPKAHYSADLTILEP